MKWGGEGEVERLLYSVLLKTKGGGSLVTFLLLGKSLPERGNDIHDIDIKGGGGILSPLSVSYAEFFVYTGTSSVYLSGIERLPTSLG